MVLQRSGTALRPFDKLRDRRGRGRPSTSSGTAGAGDALRQAQGPPLTVWLIKKADIVRKRDFHKDKSLFLWNISGKSLSLHRKDD